MEINQDWKIDILQRPYVECIYTHSGGKRAKVKTSKKLKN
jgi:hypothetical protein